MNRRKIRLRELLRTVFRENAKKQLVIATQVLYFKVQSLLSTLYKHFNITTQDNDFQVLSQVFVNQSLSSKACSREVSDHRDAGQQSSDAVASTCNCN